MLPWKIKMYRNDDPPVENSEAEAFFDEMFDQFEEAGIPVTDKINKLADWIWDQVGKAYGEGYVQGASDEGLAGMNKQVLPPSLSVVPNISIRNQTLEQLTAERDYWQGKVDKATGWGAAVGAANEFLLECEREIRRRKS
jgi:hypothetical protein